MGIVALDQKRTKGKENGMRHFAKDSKCSSAECPTLVGASGARGMCQKHYLRWKKAGGLESVRKPTTKERFWAKVNKTATCWNWTGSTKANGYGTFGISPGKTQYAHRVSWEWANGPIPAQMMIDHTCFTHSCVNPAHLRLVTQKQNQENRAGQRSDNTSGYRGVRFQAGKWLAIVYHNGQPINAGRYLTPEEANEAVMAKRNELFTHNDLDRTKKAS